MGQQICFDVFEITALFNIEPCHIKILQNDIFKAESNRIECGLVAGFMLQNPKVIERVSKLDRMAQAAVRKASE